MIQHDTGQLTEPPVIAFGGQTGYQWVVHVDLKNRLRIGNRLTTCCQHTANLRIQVIVSRHDAGWRIHKPATDFHRSDPVTKRALYSFQQAIMLLTDGLLRVSRIIVRQIQRPTSDVDQRLAVVFHKPVCQPCVNAIGE